MKAIVKKLLAFLSIKVTILSKKNKLLQLGLNNGNSEVSDNYTTIRLKDFGITINYDIHHYIIEGLSIMYCLKNRYDAGFTFNNQVLLIKIDQLTYEIQTYEELFILNEIFINHTYNLSSPKNFHLIDIGLNVAYTSIYFAHQQNCLSVYGFEPFKPTYHQALANINLNPEVKNKINTYNYGLGNKNETITVAYDSEFKGNMGIYGVPDHLVNEQHEILNEDIIIKDAAEVLSPIVNKLIKKSDDLVLKIDCEGSEYDIFQSLTTASILQHFNVIILEWHVKGPDKICAYLSEYGYTYISMGSSNTAVGMIYAFKNN